MSCGHNENFKPKWRRGETLASLAQDITCLACGAEGAAGNVYLRTASRSKPQLKSQVPLSIFASALAMFAWPFEMLARLIAIPLAALTAGMGRWLRRVWGPLLMGGAFVTGIAASVGAAYVAAVLIGAAMSGPVELLLRAAEYEHRDAISNSPKGGYRERIDEKYAETPRQMTYINRRSVGDADRD